MPRHVGSLGLVVLSFLVTRSLAADDLRSLQPGEDGITQILSLLRQTQPETSAYQILTIRLDRLSRPEDAPILLRELPNGPVEPILATLAQLWKEDRQTQATRAADPNPEIRCAALRAVAYGSPPTAEQLGVVADRFIDDTHPAVRDAAVVAVKDYGGQIFAKLLIDRLDKVPPARLPEVVRFIAAQGKLQRNNTAAVATASDALVIQNKLEQFMSHAQAAVRAAAVSQPPPGIAAWPTPAAARLADDPDPSVRLSLARTLRGGLAGATPTAIHLSDDADPEVQGAAVDAVMSSSILRSTLRPEKLVGKLANCVNSPDPFVRGRLKKDPFSWNSSAVVEPFSRALAGDRGTRLAALEAMAFGMPEALGPAIEKLLDSPEPITRARAFAAAGNLSLRASLAMRFAQAVLIDDDASTRYAASEALARMFRADMQIVEPEKLSGEPTYVRRRPDLKLPAGADPRAVTLLQAYGDHVNADQILDLLDSNNPAEVNAAIALLQDLHDRPWGDVKPLITRAAERGARASALVGIVIPEATRDQRAGVRGPPEPTNGLTRALRKYAPGAGRDAALARVALRETPMSAAVAARSLLKDPVPSVRALALFAARGDGSKGDLPPEVLVALDDPDPTVAAQAASAVYSALASRRSGEPPVELPQPEADRLAAADASVRVIAIAESAKAAGAKPVFLTQWLPLMRDPDPAVRAAVAAALKQVYAASASADLKR